MANSKFALKIIRTDGNPVYLKPGGKSEVDLKTAIISQVAKHIMVAFDDILDKDGLLVSIAGLGVGFGRSQAHVLNDIDAAVDDHEIRKRLARAITEAVEISFQKTLSDLKADVEPIF